MSVPLWVVKLGGSLWDSGALRPWLAELARPAAARVVIVPGGGPFADAVRAAQPLLGYGAAAAHRMAILGMEQYGLALLDLEPALVPARSVAALTADGPNAVWLPASLACDADVEESWDVTSDTLAAWLAERLGAARLVLVKSAPLPSGGAVDARDLARRGVVDPILPGRLERLSAVVVCVHRDDRAAFAASRRGGPPAGTRLLSESAPAMESVAGRAAWTGTSCS